MSTQNLAKSKSRVNMNEGNSKAGSKRNSTVNLEQKSRVSSKKNSQSNISIVNNETPRSRATSASKKSNGDILNSILPEPATPNQPDPTAQPPTENTSDQQQPLQIPEETPTDTLPTEPKSTTPPPQYSPQLSSTSLPSLLLLEEEIEIPVSTRALISPPPPPTQTGFIFLNTDYYQDEFNEPVINVSINLSRPQSVGVFESELDLRNSVNETAKKSARVDGYQTPVLRATSPTEVIEKVNVEVNPSETDQQQIGELKTEGNQSGTEQVAVDEIIDRDEVVGKLKVVLEKREKLKSRNLFLQNRLGEWFKKKRTEDSRDTEKSVSDQSQRYQNCLSSLQSLSQTYATLKQSNLSTLQEYKSKLLEKQAEVNEKSLEFIKYKRQIALSAENSRSGKSIPKKVVEGLELLEARKESEVVSVRLENIKLRNKLKRHEMLLRQKEELADGLHLIDFEQLKIENQTYNEKIEERNETENVSLRNQLAELDAEVGHERDHLPLSKQSRDTLRENNLILRQKNGLLGNTPLLKDFEDRVETTQEVIDKINDLRIAHAEYSAKILKIKRKIQKAQLA
ncbi:Coiled-coil domain-containing protein 96 [Nowakowskiella sp. JEL0407]|nr:Coiled-coil domain-containing protein 96 [Nowakowskiella sp. JEL0407]